MNKKKIWWCIVKKQWKTKVLSEINIMCYRDSQHFLYFYAYISAYVLYSKLKLNRINWLLLLLKMGNCYKIKYTRSGKIIIYFNLLKYSTLNL